MDIMTNIKLACFISFCLGICATTIVLLIILFIKDKKKGHLANDKMEK